MKTAVITAVRGRTTHLRNQLKSLAHSTVQPGHHVLVAIDDDDVPAAVPAADHRTTIIAFTSGMARIPMAAARNLGAEAALAHGADLLIFLDVDCIPAPDMIGRYVRAAHHPDHRNALLCGPVTYLPAPGAGGYDLARLHLLADPHPARPVPDNDQVLITTEYELFWSLSFALTTPVWENLGGFCTEYTGYGGEDTDFAQQAAAASVPMRWVGGAHAFHQFHPISDPPTEHLLDIVANAVVFQRRWGWWPMKGWLDAFEDRGLIKRDRQGRPEIISGR